MYDRLAACSRPAVRPMSLADSCWVSVDWAGLNPRIARAGTWTTGNRSLYSRNRSWIVILPPETDRYRNQIIYRLAYSDDALQIARTAARSRAAREGENTQLLAAPVAPAAWFRSNWGLGWVSGFQQHRNDMAGELNSSRSRQIDSNSRSKTKDEKGTYFLNLI